MKRLLPLLLICSVTLVSGCSMSTVRFDGVGPDGTTGREVRYVLESDAGNEGSVTVSAKARRRDEVSGRETDTMRFRITVDNASTDPMHVPLAKISVRDDAGRQWRQVSVAAPEGSGTDDLVAPPQARTSIDLLYDAGAPDTLKTTGSVTLDWGYRFREQETTHATRFLPVQFRRSHVTWSTGFWYGWGHHHHYYGGFGPSWCW